MNRVKSKANRQTQLIGRFSNESRWLALGAVDLHFHGAFGVDLMKASSSDLDRLSKRLFSKKVAAFLPTTLSASVADIESALVRLGAWINSKHQKGPVSGEAFPLGIHLEGPFIARACCGAHPPGNLMPPKLSILQRWQELSGRTIAKITLAPETAPWPEVKKILAWAKNQRISISLGHSHADSLCTNKALQAGANSLTHAWNAMPFHHRDPGILGVALGRPELFIEVIPDNAHVADAVVEWTMGLHPKGVCFVSDAVPAAHTQKQATFGPLRVQVRDGAGRTADGALAGGAASLFETFQRFWSRQPQALRTPTETRIQLLLQALSEWPLQSLPGASRWTEGLLKTHRFEYRFGRTVSARPRNLNS